MKKQGDWRTIKYSGSSPTPNYLTMTNNTLFEKNNNTRSLGEKGFQVPSFNLYSFSSRHVKIGTVCTNRTETNTKRDWISIIKCHAVSHTYYAPWSFVNYMLNPIVIYANFLSNSLTTSSPFVLIFGKTVSTRFLILVSASKTRSLPTYIARYTHSANHKTRSLHSIISKRVIAS